MSKVAVVDLDLYKYKSSFAAQKSEVVVTHKASGRSIVVPNRTFFYGRKKSKDGGKLAEINKGRDSPFTWDEFEYETIITPEPIENALYTARVMVEKDLEASGASYYKAFMGEGDSFRVGLSTLLKYKDRDDLIKPVLLDDVTEYLRKKFGAEVVTGLEADDAVVIECFRKKDHFALIEDKDFWGCPINVWDRNQPERGIVDCNKFGHLFLDDKGNVRGEGRIFFYWQVAVGDPVDTYKANCVSDVEWADKGGYHALMGCRDDKEAVETLIGVYKMLYPEPREVIGWRGRRIEGVDWKYVMNEVFQLARMRRWEGDEVSLDTVFENLKIKPDEVPPYEKR